MNSENINHRSDTFTWLVLLGHICSLVAFMVFAKDEYTSLNKLLAWSIFVFGTFPMLQYLFKRSSSYLPVIELILLSYVNAFALPVFFQTEQKLAVKMLYVDELPVTQTLFLALIGMVALYVGYKIASSLFKNLKVPRININVRNPILVIYGFVLCILFIFSWKFSFGPFQGLINILVNRDLGVALLALLYFRNSMGFRSKVFTIFLLVILVLIGVSTSMTQAMLQPIMVWFICRWMVTGKLEVKYFIIGIVLIFLIQPVKLEYRKAFWGMQDQLSTLQQVGIISVLFVNYWFISTDVKVDKSSTSRSSLLLQTAHVVDWTPNVVSYRNGETLSTFLVAWIPRPLWPGKPISQQANIYYAIDYGVTTRQGIKKTMFGVGHLGEIFMNFGATGIMPIYFIIGMFTYLLIYLLRIPKNIRSLLRDKGEDPNIATNALFVTGLVQIMFIGSTVTDAYGALIQMLIVQGSIMFFFSGKRIQK
jgi:hypothetical protein